MRQQTGSALTGASAHLLQRLTLNGLKLAGTGRFHATGTI